MARLWNLPSLTAVIVALVLQSAPRSAQAETVRDRLWVWGHPAGVYNASYLRPLGRASTIEPVEAANSLGLKNMIFVRYDHKPPPPFDSYYTPFQKLDRVYWSLVAAGGSTSAAEREAAFSLAERNKNIVGFILDDFFHEPSQGNAADPPPQPPWLAANQPTLPVTFTVAPPQPVQCDVLELTQTDWPTGDYRAKDVAVDLSTNGKAWEQVAKGTLANRPAAVLRLPLPATRFKMVRIRFLDTHDKHGAKSVGLGKLRFLAAGQVIDSSGWTATASSTYPGYDARSPLSVAPSPDTPLRASLTPLELRALHERKTRGRKLPIMAVIYTGQVKPRARAHIAEVDQLCLWTWRPGDLKNLEANFAALEKLAPGKQLYLGCYMYDFHECKPLPVALMRKQVELGYQWLKAGRIAGMIFLATPNVDVGLEAVDWTRQWIRTTGDQVLPRSSGTAKNFH